MRRVGVLVVACLSGLAVQFAAVRADACTCVVTPTGCRELATADAVFEATVESLETAPAGVTYSGARLRRINLINLKALRGTAQPTIVTPWNSESCGYPFTPGVRYLVVAHRGSDGRFAVYLCGQTRPLEEARTQLEYVDTLNGSPDQTRVWGSVYRTSNQLWPFTPTPVAGATVTLKGPAQRTVTSDAEGRFLISGLPRGAYNVEAATATEGGTPLRSLVDRFEWKPDETHACAAVALGIAATGRISGTMRNEYGESVPGAIVWLHAVDQATQLPGSSLTSTTTDAEGHYDFAELPPGSYAVTANWSTGPTFVAPHPPTVARTPSGSEAIPLGDDRSQTLAPLQLERLAAIPVTGTVRDQRGAPVAGVRISGWGTHHNNVRYAIATPAISGADGQFELLLWRGQRYLIEVDRGAVRLASIELAASAEPITITVPQ